MVAMKKTSLCMTPVLDEYDKLREQPECGSEFWDVVVLTTSDAMQQQVYELEIENKLGQKELPTCARYHVIHDPPGPKIGSGGSTMYTLSKLVELEPDWKSKKILLMHAGGSSQRLPSASVLGKAFITIPIGNRVYTMFDVKLALCMPFAKRLPPGVFISCPDTFEAFTYGNNGDWSFGDREGFLALAHPSPVYVGKAHGVFVLEDRNSKLDTEVLNCKKVLQKPTEMMMKDEGALLCPSEVPDGIRARETTGHDWVFTDSQYFFDHSISEKLLGFYHQHKPLTSEICAYGDFMQPLGKLADGSYVTNCKNIMSMSDSVVSTRTALYQLLKGSPLNVVALKHSKFYHIGTMIEYIDSFCSNFDLKEELGLSRFCYSACVSAESDPGCQPGGCVVHSLITNSCHFSNRSVVEYCRFTGSANVTVHDNCVVSDCEFSNGTLDIPSSTFMQTVPVFSPSGSPMYVTLLFSIHEDMKAKVSSVDDIPNLSYFGRGLLSVTSQSDPVQLFGKGNPLSLWHAKLFHLSSSPQDSLTSALQKLNSILSRSKRSFETSASNDDIANGGHSSAVETPGVHVHHANGAAINGHEPTAALYSFADVIKYKDAKRMIERRNELSSQIKSALSPASAN